MRRDEEEWEGKGRERKGREEMIRERRGWGRIEGARGHKGRR